MAVNKFFNFTSKIDEFTKKPEKYLSLQEAPAEAIKTLTKELYNFTKKNEQKNQTPDALPELVVEKLDEEQIWQQIELQNNSICNKLVSDIAHLLAKNDLSFSLKPEKSIRRVHYDHNIKKDNETLDKEQQNDKPMSKIKRKKIVASIVDDKFFKLQEMEEFLEKVEKGEVEDDGEDIDYFQNSDYSENEDQLCYNDFFDQPYDNESMEQQNLKKVKFNVGGEEKENKNYNEYDDNEEEEEEEEDEDDGDDSNNDLEEDESENENSVTKQPSTFEARQERLKSRIEALEKAALKEKPWQLKGEVTANSRPQNSLLEEYVEFDIVTRPAPVFTEKTTLKLEDIILQRIKDKAWDDVVRKIKPIEGDLEYKKKLVLDQEKSKLSLAQIYEQEYLNQLDKKNESVIDKPEQEAPEHQEIRIMMNKLFSKLDALSNFHFTPKEVREEIKIICNIPAINMEEVAPVATSDAALLAPEEVKPKSKGELTGKSERTTTDKKRERRQKKIKQQLKFKKLAEKEKEKLKKNSKEELNKNIYQKLLQKITKSSNLVQFNQKEEGKYMKSSKTFFSKLQDETNSPVKKGLELRKPKFENKLRSKKSINK